MDQTLKQVTLRSLTEQALPQLLKQLDALSAAGQLAPEHLDEGLQQGLLEAHELLSLLLDATPAKHLDQNVGASQGSSIADDEGNAESLAACINSLEDEESGQHLEDADTDTDDEDMSDEQAQALLASMDAPESADDEALQLEEPEEESSEQGEMDDDEAQRLLALMDGDGDGEDDQTSPAASTSADDTQAQDSEDDDLDTMSMLQELEGEEADDSDESATQSSSDEQGVSSDSSEAQDAELIEDFPEWKANEFSSDPEMKKEFLVNSEELLATMDDAILKLEQDPSDKDMIEEIFRAAHTLKGAAGMFGFVAIEKVMHQMENLFDKIRKGKLVATAETIDVVLKGVDVLRILLEAIQEGKPSGYDCKPVIVDLNAVLTGKAVKSSASTGTSGATSAQPQAAATPPTPAKKSEAEGGAKRQENSTIRVDLARLDTLVNLVGELVIDRTRFATIEENIREIQPQSKLASHMSETVQLFGRHLVEIQDIIMKLRMVPIGNALNKFPRLVRDLARQLGKDLDLIIEGEATELDKTLVEQIGDPLIHLVRNACDHGVELPEERTKAGKNPRGLIELSAHQEGNSINIVISDDGKGMDAAKIRRKGIEKGLIEEDSSLPEREILNLIFEPGFSTAEQVTTVSGRGVGMDVVKKQISKLKGTVEIQSQPGKGTKLVVQLPLTLAIVQSLLVRSKEEIYAMPLSSVIESIRISPSDIQRIGEVEVIKLRDDVLPLLHLDHTLSIMRKDQDYWYGLPKDDKDHGQDERMLRRLRERLFVVVVGSAERRFGIVVDSLLNQQEMVIKSMSQLMSDVPCFAGGAVLGNGEVVLVLDIPELESHSKGKFRSLAHAM